MLIDELLWEAVDPAALGRLTQQLPARFFHMTHDQAMVTAIVQHGFDLKMFGYTGKKFNSPDLTRFDPAGVYCQDEDEIGKRFTPWVTFRLRGTPTALVSSYHFLPDLARAYGCVGVALSQRLRRQGISVVQNVREFIVLDPGLIEIVDWSGKHSSEADPAA